MRGWVGAAVAFALAALSAGCSGGGSAAGPAPGSGPTPAPTGSGSGGIPVSIGPSKIKHVVFVVQENRSFDNIFGGLDQNGKPFPGADTVSNPNPGEPTPHDHHGNPVKMQQGLLEECYSPAHDHPESVEEVNGGQMNGFDLDIVTTLGCAKGTPPPDYVYRYVKEAEVAPYWAMGEQYAIADRMYEPLGASSFTPHLFSVAGQSDGTIDNPSSSPWGCDSPPGTIVNIMIDDGGYEEPGPYPCFNMASLAGILDARGLAWRYYGAPLADYGYLWEAYDAIAPIRNGPDWSRNVVMPPAQFLTDVSKGTLKSMTWVTPTVLTSDHPVSTSNMGPSWIASVVNAVGTSQFWDTTAIFITWDDWGGWYDHVPPPVVGPFGLGIRTPLIVVSPYARGGYVSHVPHTMGSILHFAEEALNLPSLGQEDARADDLTDAFDFTRPPRTFAPFAMAHSPSEVRAAASRSRRAAPGAAPNDE